MLPWSSEITGLVMRNAAFGDPYDGVATVVGSEGVAIVKATLMTRPFTRDDWRSITDELRRLGFSSFEFHRTGRTHWLRRPL